MKRRASWTDSQDVLSRKIPLRLPESEVSPNTPHDQHALPPTTQGNFQTIATPPQYRAKPSRPSGHSTSFPAEAVPLFYNADVSMHPTHHQSVALPSSSADQRVPACDWYQQYHASTSECSPHRREDDRLNAAHYLDQHRPLQHQQQQACYSSVQEYTDIPFQPQEPALLTSSLPQIDSPLPLAPRSSQTLPVTEQCAEIIHQPSAYSTSFPAEAVPLFYNADVSMHPTHHQSVALPSSSADQRVPACDWYQQYHASTSECSPHRREDDRLNAAHYLDQHRPLQHQQQQACYSSVQEYTDIPFQPQEPALLTSSLPQIDSPLPLAPRSSQTLPVTEQCAEIIHQPSAYSTSFPAEAVPLFYNADVSMHPTHHQSVALPSSSADQRVPACDWYQQYHASTSECSPHRREDDRLNAAHYLDQHRPLQHQQQQACYSSVLEHTDIPFQPQEPALLTSSLPQIDSPLPLAPRSSQTLPVTEQCAEIIHQPSAYSTSFLAEAVPLFYNADVSMHPTHHQSVALPSSSADQRVPACDWYQQYHASTSEYSPHRREDDQLNAAHYLDQHRPLQHQQRRVGLDIAQAHLVDALTSTAGNWPPTIAVMQGVHQSTSHLPTTSQAVVRNEEGQGGTAEEQLHGARVGDAPDRSEAHQIPSVRLSTADNALRTVLLEITRSVHSTYPLSIDGEREQYSSICVAGMDYGGPNSAQRPAITLRLRDQESWQVAANYLMEMVIAGDGKRIYPPLTVSISGLKAEERYTVFLDLMPADQHLYTFSSGHWIRRPTIRFYPPSNEDSLIYVPRETFQTGSRLMMSGVDFRRVKITNKPGGPASENRIFVHSMRTYIPRYHIVRSLTEDGVAMRQQDGGVPQRESQACLEHVGTYIIPETKFIAVTAYRDRRITDLKITMNPYATSFRNRQNPSNRPT